MGKLLRERGIHYFVSHNETKANYAERVIKTTKQKLLLYVMNKQGHRYMGVLQNIEIMTRYIGLTLKRPPRPLNLEGTRSIGSRILW
ncbi:hypothetical protein BOW43_12455 [Solemya velum gill symbiont]|nr:hypothetical protein BOW43_12455 [Solemya velum gill symbiont]